MFCQNMFHGKHVSWHGQLFINTSFMNTAMFHGHLLLQRFIDKKSFLLNGLDEITGTY